MSAGLPVHTRTREALWCRTNPWVDMEGAEQGLGVKAGIPHMPHSRAEPQEV